jgi:hypothetical protein
MRIEFHPDFKEKPIFKVIFSGLRSVFKGLRFSPDGYARLTRKMGVVLVAVVIVVLCIILVVMTR